MAMAAMMPMIATTIRSSMSEKPRWPLFCCISFGVLLKQGEWLGLVSARQRSPSVRLTCRANMEVTRVMPHAPRCRSIHGETVNRGFSTGKR